LLIYISTKITDCMSDIAAQQCLISE